MRHTFLPSVAFLAGLTLVGCDRTPPAEPAPARADTSEVEKQAAEQRKRSEEASELERRAANLESRWTEMQTTVKARGRTATGGLREEVAEDVKNARAAVADLKTTTVENWWERYERALERSVDDVQADVQRVSGTKTMPAPAQRAEPAGAAAGFAGRRDAFVTDLRARIDAMESQLDGIKASGTRKTEADDVKARIDKLQDDLDRLGKVSADDWWEASSERVSEYIARVEDSIDRLDDNKASAEKPRS
jgi:hypothetical protein